MDIKSGPAIVSIPFMQVSTRDLQSTGEKAKFQWSGAKPIGIRARNAVRFHWGHTWPNIRVISATVVLPRDWSTHKGNIPLWWAQLFSGGVMVDPRQVLVFVASGGKQPEDKTDDIVAVGSSPNGKVAVTFVGGKTYEYKPENVRVMRRGAPVPLSEGDQVAIDDEIWNNVVEIVRFDDAAGSWTKVFSKTKAGMGNSLRPSAQVRIIKDAGQQPGAAAIIKYWSSIVDQLPAEQGNPNPTVRPFQDLRPIHPDSVLARFLTGAPIEEQVDKRLPIFPFSSNVSQHTALNTALSYPISVIDGPPGTGKTQTILNLVATLCATPGVAVGVISSNNAAVDNVRDKLVRLGYGFICANLGNSNKMNQFLASQARRNAELNEFLAQHEAPSAEDQAELAEKLRRLEGQILALQNQERELFQTRQELAAHRLELAHFQRYLEGHEVTDLDGVALLGRPSERIMDLLVETSVPDRSGWAFAWVTRLRRRLRYGSLRGVDTQDADVVLGLQRGYYERRIAELEQHCMSLEQALAMGELADKVREQGELSRSYLDWGLAARYAKGARRQYEKPGDLRPLAKVSANYPLILSTCHSLRNNIDKAGLLDYLIIDEASQVDLLSASLGLAAAKRVVVVGDLQQLPPIVSTEAVKRAGEPCPSPAYDYAKHSLLSSLQELYGDSLPRTLLREHYRCDPAIIGFCNEKFYDRLPAIRARQLPGTSRSTASRLRLLRSRTLRMGRRSLRRPRPCREPANQGLS